METACNVGLTIGIYTGRGHMDRRPTPVYLIQETFLTQHALEATRGERESVLNAVLSSQK